MFWTQSRADQRKETQAFIKRQVLFIYSALVKVWLRGNKTDVSDDSLDDMFNLCSLYLQDSRGGGWIPEESKAVDEGVKVSSRQAGEWQDRTWY